MKTFKVYFEMSSEWNDIEIEAESEEEAEEKFNSMCADDIMYRSGIVPDFDLDEIEEVK